MQCDENNVEAMTLDAGDLSLVYRLKRPPLVRGHSSAGRPFRQLSSNLPLTYWSGRAHTYLTYAYSSVLLYYGRIQYLH